MKNIALIILIMGAFRAVSQEGYPSEKAINVIPPSPAAAALLSFGNVPVNMLTGSPNIIIPIYTIEMKGVKVPITLSYQANGIKVEEIASSYGMGWSMSLGGVINKTIKGLNDELPYGYPNGSGEIVSQYMNDELTHTEKQSFSLGITEGGYDGEPDQFSYSFGDYQGVFIFTPDNQVMQLYGEPLEITPIYNAGSNVYEFVVIDPNGVKYYFNDRELTETVTIFMSGGTTAPLDPQNYISAWYLSKIVTTSGEEIIFQYTTASVSPSYLGSLSVYDLKSVEPAIDCNGNAPAPRFFGTSSTNRTTTIQKKIDKVVFPTGEVSVLYQSQQRSDLPGDKAVQNIVVKNKGGQIFNTFTFTHSYYSNRLFLTQLLDASTSRPYQFFYDQPQSLPVRTSKAQDYWGFYNGKTTNTSLIPKINGAPLNGVPLFHYTEGGDREPQFSLMKSGILDRIIYPTGGETRFTYESHQYGNITGTVNVYDTTRTVTNQIATVTADPSGWKESTFLINFDQEILVSSNVWGNNTKTQLINSTGTILFAHFSSGSMERQTQLQNIFLPAGTYKLRAFNYESDFFAGIQATYKEQTGMTIEKFKSGGGLRVKEIADYSDSQTIVARRTYEYSLKDEPDRSSGILVTNYIHDHLQNKSGQLDGCGTGSTYNAVYYVRLTGSAVPLSLSAGSHVEYSEVIEKQENGENIGKTITFYTSSRETENRDINSYTYPYMSSFSRGYRRGKVKRVETYKWEAGGYNLVRELQNDYQSVPSSNSFYGISIGLVFGNPAVPFYNVYNHNSYSYLRDYYAHTRSVEKSYDGATTEKRTDFYYDNTVHYRPTRISTLKSDGSNEVIYTAYPHDYANTTGFIGDMKTNHLIAYPVEQVKYKEVGNIRTILSGNITTYKTGGKGLVDQVLSLETLKEVQLASFKFSNRLIGQLPPGVGNNASYSPDTRYKVRLTYNEYDTKGNPLQYTPSDGVPVSYVWGYGGQYPVAEIRSATRSQVTGTGFSQSVLDGANSTDAQIAAQLNTIRSHANLGKAQVMTYRYIPLIGVSSSTDASGRTTWYDYDSFGRLWRIRDHFGNVTEEYRYNYRQ